MSVHETKVVRIGNARVHPNADALEILDVWGFQCVVRKGEWKPGDLAAYIEPDSIVPATEQFAFLGEHRRIRARRFRGVYSQGLLVKPPDGAKEGDDVFALMGIEHYEPANTAADSITGGPGWVPVYDVENWRKFGDVLVPGELVHVTEKIHGANGRFVFDGERLWLGSRTNWKVQTSPWGRAAEAIPQIEAWCREHPNVALYGEVFGPVQSLKYGGELQFRAFDSYALAGARWTSDYMSLPESLRVPLLYSGAYDRAFIETLAEGQSTIPGADHIREGCVVAAFERMAGSDVRQMGPVKLKIVGNAYLERG